MSRTPWPRLSAAFVQNNLTGHKILGLTLAGLLYLISLSGTVTVFYTQLQRWESPQLPDVRAITPQALAAAIDDARASLPADTAETGLYIYAPTPENPRLNIAAGDQVRAYDNQGHYAGKGNHPITNALGELHYYLHLPYTIGSLVVGAAGVAMLSLILSGFLAHPRLLKDAFLWRSQAGARLNRTDLHNRIAVWAAPFHIVIALTGAVAGLVNILLLISALSLAHGDTALNGAPLFGPRAVQTVQGRVTDSSLITALNTLKTLRPDATPSYLSLNNLGTDHESLTVTADIRDRLVYGDTWQFDGRGRLISTRHLSDGAAGKQIYASLYRLHFGSFGGIWVQWAYALLGAGLCLICATGMDIWLLKSAQKGKAHPRLHKVWTGFIWGAPLAMAVVSALCLCWPSAPFRPLFWGLLVVLVAASLLIRQSLTSQIGRYGLGAILLMLVTAHALRFGPAALSAAGLWPNVSLIVIGLAFLLFPLPRRIGKL